MNEVVQTNEFPVLETEISEDESFSYEGYQVVRGEFFAHVFEPSFTFSDSKIYVNTACIKKLPMFEYIQILVNPEEKKLAVRPCREEDKDSFRWCSASTKRSPKQITCRIFFAKVITLMGWNPDYRYKLLGKLIRSHDDILFIFDLDSPEVFVRELKEDGKSRPSRTPSYPEQWKNQFGVPAVEHSNGFNVSIFDGYAVFSLEKESRKKSPAPLMETAGNYDASIVTNVSNEETTYEQLCLSGTGSNPGD